MNSVDQKIVRLRREIAERQAELDALTGKGFRKREPFVDLNERQLAALRIGEHAIEDLPFMDRDDMVANGLAVRAWPTVTGADWETWLTPEGAKLRLELFYPRGNYR